MTRPAAATTGRTAPSCSCPGSLAIVDLPQPAEQLELVELDEPGLETVPLIRSYERSAGAGASRSVRGPDRDIQVQPGPTEAST